MTFLIVLLVLAGFIGFVFVGTYNKVVSLRESGFNAKKQIDVQLDRRFKVFENLINVVKGVMDYEKTVLKDIVSLRNQAKTATKAGNDAEAFALEDKISQIASQVSVVFEQYPELKALNNAQQLQEEIVNTENKLSFAKQHYNDSVESFNAYKKSFFPSMVVGFFRNIDHQFDYWELTTEKAQAAEEYTVKL